jgi:hypothetical protein
MNFTALTSSHVQNLIYTFSDAAANGIRREDTYPRKDVSIKKLKQFRHSSYQMACNLSAGAQVGSVWFVMKSWMVRKPEASPDSSPEYS